MPSVQRARAVPFIVVLVLVLAACSGSGAAESAGGGGGGESAGESQATGGGENEVVIQGSSFAPGELTVAAGTTVTFVSNDSLPHTVTEGSDGTAVEDPIVDEPIGNGDEVTVTFDEPGTYNITCTIHPSMNMTVVVEG
jgi:plastocyanin